MRLKAKLFLAWIHPESQPDCYLWNPWPKWKYSSGGLSILHISSAGLKLMHVILLHCYLLNTDVFLLNIWYFVWDRRSALMVACESDSVETVAALLRGGANTQLVDSLGHRATDYSAATGNQRIIQMLQDGAPPGTVWGLTSFFIWRDKSDWRVCSSFKHSLSLLLCYYKSSLVSSVKSGGVNEVAHASSFIDIKWQHHMKPVAAASKIITPSLWLLFVAVLLWILAVSLLPQETSVTGSGSGGQLDLIVK